MLRHPAARCRRLARLVGAAEEQLARAPVARFAGAGMVEVRGEAGAGPTAAPRRSPGCSTEGPPLQARRGQLDAVRGLLPDPERGAPDVLGPEGRGGRARGGPRRRPRPADPQPVRGLHRGPAVAAPDQWTRTGKRRRPGRGPARPGAAPRDLPVGSGGGARGDPRAGPRRASTSGSWPRCPAGCGDGRPAALLRAVRTADEQRLVLASRRCRALTPAVRGPVGEGDAGAGARRRAGRRGSQRPSACCWVSSQAGPRTSRSRGPRAQPAHGPAAGRRPARRARRRVAVPGRGRGGPPRLDRERSAGWFGQRHRERGRLDSPGAVALGAVELAVRAAVEVLPGDADPVGRARTHVVALVVRPRRNIAAYPSLAQRRRRVGHHHVHLAVLGVGLGRDRRAAADPRAVADRDHQDRVREVRDDVAVDLDPQPHERRLDRGLDRADDVARLGRGPS